MVLSLKHLYKTNPLFQITEQEDERLSLKILIWLMTRMYVRVCMRRCARLRGQTMTGRNTLRKRIIYAYAFSYVFYSADCIQMVSGKWRSMHFSQIPIFSQKTSFTFQLLQLSDAMKPEDGSCMDKNDRNVSPIQILALKCQ